jgi:hypothetical protein
MQSSLIGKIRKANLYAKEPDRVRFSEFRTTFRGDNDSHTVSYRDGKWHCTCGFFPTWRICSHAMAIEKLMRQMLPREAREALALQPDLVAGG